jgi:hypothetical protein
MKASDSIKGEEYLGQISDYRFLKKDSGAWSYLVRITEADCISEC